MGKEKLKWDKKFGRIPIREVSGLCVRQSESYREVLAVGDDEFGVASAPLAPDGDLGEFSLIRSPKEIAALFPERESSDWEAVDVDSVGRVYLLAEGLRQIDVVSADFKTRLASWHLAAPQVAGWTHGSNSLGEGLARLPGGQWLVAKEKDPALFVVFEVPDDETFASGSTLRTLEATRTIELHGDELPSDISDLCWGADGWLYLLSDESQTLSRVSLPDTNDGRAEIVTTFSLPKKPKNPEGVIVVPRDDQLMAIAAFDDKDEGIRCRGLTIDTQG